MYDLDTANDYWNEQEEVSEEEAAANESAARAIIAAEFDGLYLRQAWEKEQIASFNPEEEGLLALT